MSLRTPSRAALADVIRNAGRKKEIKTSNTNASLREPRQIFPVHSKLRRRESGSKESSSRTRRLPQTAVKAIQRAPEAEIHILVQSDWVHAT